ncbi:MAG: phage holin family protein [Streptosporangiaceae bacterium]|nr:phage holin family protein [Streptosporangiaceae bacterium]
MVRSQTPGPAGADQSLGDLVALAAKDVSQLVRYEIDLAKAELRGDMRRVTRAGALGGIAGFVGCLLLVMLCFAYAYGLVAAGIWAWAAFLIVAGTLGLLGAAAVGIAALGLRRVSGLSRTRQTLNEDMAVLRRDNSHPEITAREPG